MAVSGFGEKEGLALNPHFQFEIVEATHD